MTVKQFLAMFIVQTAQAACNATVSILESPPGDEPSVQDVELSSWYLQRTDDDRKRVEQLMQKVADQTLFNVLTVLDGVTAIENLREKGTLELYYVKDGGRILLNDPRQEELHNMIGNPLEEDQVSGLPEAREYEVGEAQDLLASLRVGDGLDIQRVPRKLVGLQEIENYDPKTAPAILLPKGEHMRVSPDGVTSLE
jgi:hypothetical protein